jgi:EAL domain-containing protein (putative c-di-GMP-specific phosphodiesterase class I)
MSPLAPTTHATTEDTDWPEMLRTAAEGAGLRAVYQPIIDLTRGAVVGYEALTRFVGYPIRNPEPWFAAAHTHGRSAELQATALRTALSERPGLPPGCFLAVNVSPDVLHHRAVQRVWADEGTLEGLVIDLTAPHTHATDLATDLDRLRAAGALIAVHHTGDDLTGLATLRPAMIKIDRALIHDETNRTRLHLTRTFAAHIDAALLAHGIENQQELETVSTLDIPLAQGYHLGRPSRPWAGTATRPPARQAPPRDGSRPE